MTHSISLWRRGAISRPAARAASSPASTAQRSPASSPAVGSGALGGFGLFSLGLFAFVSFVALAVLPIAAFAVTGEAYGFLIYPILAFGWWAERYERRFQARQAAQEGAPEVETTPAPAVPVYVVDPPRPGFDPDAVLTARPMTIVEAMESAWTEGKAAGRTNAQIEAELVGILAGVPRRDARRTVGTGGKLWQEARQEVQGGPEGRGERGRLGHGGLKGYLGGGR